MQANLRWQPELWWITAPERDRGPAEAFAADLRTHLRQLNPHVDVQLEIASDGIVAPEVPAEARWIVVLVSPAALTDHKLLDVWRETLSPLRRQKGGPTLLAAELTRSPWPAWLYQHFERVVAASETQKGAADAYRLSLAAIISKYIGQTEFETVN